MEATAGEPRLTEQRRAVLAALRASSDHPTAAELLARVREHHPRIGLATVYRALKTLTRAGLAEELTTGGGAATRFDGNTGGHDHLVCSDCSRVLDISRVSQPAEPVGPDLSVAAEAGFVVTGYELTIHGQCPQCQRAG